MSPEPGWTDRLKAEVPMADRAAFLNDLQGLVASVRVGRHPAVTPLLKKYPEVALGYLDNGDKKDQARRALAKPEP